MAVHVDADSLLSDIYFLHMLIVDTIPTVSKKIIEHANGFADRCDRWLDDLFIAEVLQVVVGVTMLTTVGLRRCISEGVDGFVRA